MKNAFYILLIGAAVQKLWPFMCQVICPLFQVIKTFPIVISAN